MTTISPDMTYFIAMDVRRFWVRQGSSSQQLSHFFHSLFTRSAAWRQRHVSKGARLKLSGRSWPVVFGRRLWIALSLVDEGLPPADSEEGGQALEPIVAGLREQSRRFRNSFLSGVARSDFSGLRGGENICSRGTPRQPAVQSNRLFRSFTSWQAGLKNRVTPRPLSGGEDRTFTGEIPPEFPIFGKRAPPKRASRRKPGDPSDPRALLLVAFGSLVAAVIPLAIGQLAIATTLAITGFLAQRWHLSILVQNLATMLGLGLGIDYALLMVSRFREAIAAGNNGPAAGLIAARQAGRTLLISASTVAIGFLALLTVPISEIRSIGVAGFLVTGMSVLLTNTLVPAALVLLGPRIDFGRFCPLLQKLDAHRAARTGIRWRAVGKG